MDLEFKSTVNFTVLSCNVKEEDVSKRESCSLFWDDLTMDIRPEERVTLSESDTVLQQGYEKKEQTIFIIQRSPLQTITIGRFGGEMQNYHLPYMTVLPVPLFTPKNRIKTQPPEETPSVIQMTHLNGPCAAKREVTGLVSNLPQVIQPNKLPVRFSSLISPPPNLHDTTGH
ncbi:Hypothetical predicted protein [Pelobates cultripes]|uniref:Uncharacterized protein n=1 Tax=Pelobates cultripes TaxID=61616 RepID=A0AAD1W538_PELCU|nr:Hypothetical predicted protein [Pelobates cultripes]